MVSFNCPRLTSSKQLLKKLTHLKHTFLNSVHKLKKVTLPAGSPLTFLSLYSTLVLHPGYWSLKFRRKRAFVCMRGERKVRDQDASPVLRYEIHYLKTLLLYPLHFICLFASLCVSVSVSLFVSLFLCVCVCFLN